METLWPLVFEFCDLCTCKTLMRTKSFYCNSYIQRRLKQRSVNKIVSFLKTVHSNMPWRSRNPLSQYDRYDMRQYLRIRNSKIGIKYFRHQLMQYYLFYPQYGSHQMYLFNFRSTNKEVEERREEIREQYTGSRYDLAKYVLTMGKEEVITHGI